MYKMLTTKVEIDQLVESYFWIMDFPRALTYFGDQERYGYGSGPRRYNFHPIIRQKKSTLVIRKYVLSESPQHTMKM
ncbi:hypothetical protein DFQ00_102586 [Paenibacillus barcinonensis]|uniref:Uncharacterized protein n=1 Tax=Paenibacillus barcinonensis TaxID=198119 RepID=A0A2V4WI14_PAEBA|nr:hypothetical protein DFQ00_102586 [Paenibacillus barcinonensis]